LQCDDGTELVLETRDVHDHINGVPYSVKRVYGWHCPACGEIEFTRTDDSAKRVNAAIQAAGDEAQRQRGAEVRATRKKLNLTQAEAGRLFGGGVVAFSEYENGKTQPHKSTILLLRLLNRHPELLSELR
jgi:HTH-type transcriptional regulator/antitoxin MqsA